MASTTTSHLFEQHIQQVYAWAYRVLGRHHDALDVVQDVYVKWDEQCAKEAPKQPRGWLRTVTLNRAIDLRRKADSRFAASGGRLGRAGNAETHAPASERLEQSEMRDEVRGALETLTDVQRCILVAKVYDGMTFSEIASEFDLAVPTVKTHYLRAVRSLRNRLHPDWDREMGT